MRNSLPALAAIAGAMLFASASTDLAYAQVKDKTVKSMKSAPGGRIVVKESSKTTVKTTVLKQSKGSSSYVKESTTYSKKSPAKKQIVIVKKPPVVVYKPPTTKHRVVRVWRPGLRWRWLVVPTIYFAEELEWCHYHRYPVAGIAFHTGVQCHHHEWWNHPSIRYVETY
jgi:hypothetical protein